MPDTREMKAQRKASASRAGKPLGTPIHVGVKLPWIRPRIPRPTRVTAKTAWPQLDARRPCFGAISVHSILRSWSLGNWKQQLIAVRVVDLDHVVPPPRGFVGNRAVDDFTAKLGKPVLGQLDEEPGLVSARGVLAENDLAFSTIHLADVARAVTFMPTLLESEPLKVEIKRAVHVGNEEHRARVPPLNHLAFHGLLGNPRPFRIPQDFAFFAGFDLPALLRATAWRMSALKADSSTSSPSWMSIARRAFPSRLELKRWAGSCREAPLAKVSFTTFL